MIDTHCHIDMILERTEQRSYSELRNSSEWWPEWAIQVGCDETRIDAAIALAEEHPELRFTAGQHPHEASRYSNEIHQRLLQVMEHPLCVGWGECGLDYHYEHSPREMQRQVAVRQFDAAVQLDKTLVVHARSADNDIYPLLADLPPQQRVHLHCYTGSPQFAEKVLALSLDLCIGYTGIITFKNADDIQQAVRVTPIDRLLLETDSPFLAPTPFRGKTAHPGMLYRVAEAVAELKGISVEEVDRLTSATARRLYSF